MLVATLPSLNTGELLLLFAGLLSDSTSQQSFALVTSMILHPRNMVSHSNFTFLVDLVEPSDGCGSAGAGDGTAFGGGEDFAV